MSEKSKENSSEILRMKDITKIFPGVKANDQVNFTVEKGEIHALVGENGAGKTTLMNILYGLYEPDGGEIYYKGEKTKINDPEKAIKLGIGMVHQHFMLVEPLTVTENIILGSEPLNNISIDKQTATQQVKDISEKYKLHLDPDAKIKDISVGMQQRVEIIKILYRGAELLIFDEPTAVLTPQETEELYEIFRSLTEQGKTIIFITHKLKEVKAISDRITVLRQGKSIDTVPTESVTEEDVAEMMVGREVLLRVEKDEAEVGEMAMEIRDLEVKDNRDLPAVRGINLDIKEGEILGIAGVEGNGQTELVEAITGLRDIENGSIQIKGKDISDATPREIKEESVGHIPEDRHKRGLILDFDLKDNLILGFHYLNPFASGIRLNDEKIASNADNLIDIFDIRTSGREAKMSSLSGGNQQKAIIAREFNQEPEVLIAAQPTRGVDVGSIEFIHNRLLEQRAEGKAVLLVSADLNEVLSLSDRIAVIYDGQIVEILDAEATDEYELGALMTGSTPEKEVGSSE